MPANLRKANLVGIAVIALVTSIAQANPTLNGWDTDNVYVIKSPDNSSDFSLYSSWFGGVDKVNKHLNAIVTAKIFIVGEDTGNPPTGQDDTIPLSLTFSNAEEGGVNSPKGARLFSCEGRSRDHVGGTKTDIFVHEWAFNTNGNGIRKAYLGNSFEGSPGTFNLVPSDNVEGNSVKLGNIRFNPKKNTLAIGAVLITGGGTTASTKVYEFDLPDWAHAANTDQEGQLRAVQTYVFPVIPGGNPGRIFIDFDDDGNLYVGGNFDANGNGGPDVVRMNTLGLVGGGITTMALGTNAELLIDGHVESSQNPNFDCRSAAVRTSQHQLVVLARNGEGNSPAWPMYLYDLNLPRAANGNLRWVNTGASSCTNASTGDFATSCAGGIGRHWQMAQRDLENGGVYMAMGDFRGTPGGFQVLNSDGSFTTNLGSSLCGTPGNGNGTPACYKGASWDGASPPPAPGSPVPGACCLPGGTCASMTQGACYAKGGYFHGEGTTCGQFPCPNPTGACCSPCNGGCFQGAFASCPTGSVFLGVGATCSVNACSNSLICGTPAMDADCDGDVDMNDFGAFQRCYNPGNAIPPPPSNCGCFDRNGPQGGADGVIDHFDFDAFMNCARRDKTSPGTCQ